MIEILEARRPAYVLSGYEWSDEEITWSIADDGVQWEHWEVGNGDCNIIHTTMDRLAPRSEWLGIVEQVFKDWGELIPVDLVQIPDSDEVDIRIGMIDYFSGAPNAFSYYPGNGIDGDITIVSADFEEFSTSVWEPDRFYRIMAHEAGHALGLGHSDEVSLMAVGSEAAFTIQDDDIAGIQAIYGPVDANNDGHISSGDVLYIINSIRNWRAAYPVAFSTIEYLNAQ